MVKHIELLRNLEATAIDAVCDLLRYLPAAEVTPIADLRATGLGSQVDGLVRVHYSGAVGLLVIEMKTHGAPRFVRSTVYELESCVARIRRDPAHAAQLVVPMRVCPYLSPESRAICRDHDVAYLDLEGNARLVFDRVYIERSVPTKPKSETRTLRSVFRPKAAAILRALLREPDRARLVTDLAASANAGLGHVSNVCKALLERKWVDRRHDGIVLTQPYDLIQTWRENYRRPGGDRFDAYTHLRGQQFDDLVRRGLNARPGLPRAVHALGSAAQWIAPFNRDATRSFYPDTAGARALRETLDGGPASTGPKMWSSTSLRMRPSSTMRSSRCRACFCTSPIVTYLDLWCGNDREREAADHLPRETLPWIA